MKLKYYLRGLGVGIICTAILMGIALSGNKKEKLTDTEIIERARLLGMVMEEEQATEPEAGQEPQGDGQEGQPDPKNQAQGEAPGANDSEQDREADPDGDGASRSPDSGDGEQEEAQGEQGDGEETAPDGDTEGSGEEAPEGTPEDGTDDGMEVAFEIAAGDHSEDICERLYQAGLISDAVKFNAYMTEKGVDVRLRVGVHQIPKGATEDEIMEILQK